MLSIFAASGVRPEPESIDRDPGIVHLMTALARGLRRGAALSAQRLRASHQAADEASLHSSSSAWPYDHRSH